MKIRQHYIKILLLTFLICIISAFSTFASVNLTADWEDSLKGGNATIQAININGTSSAEQLLNLFYPVGSEFETYNGSFNPNTVWGGTWSKTETKEDYLTDIGTSDIWTYRKWASGMSECYGTSSASAAYYAQWPSGAYDYNMTVNFPSIFSEAPVVTFAGWAGNGFALTGTTTSISNTSMPLYIVASSGSCSQKYYIHVKGKWKNITTPETKYVWKRTA